VSSYKKMNEIKDYVAYFSITTKKMDLLRFGIEKCPHSQKGFNCYLKLNNGPGMPGNLTTRW